MASSLVLGSFDLCDPASPVRLDMGWDRGAPVPSVSEIESTVLDGSMVVGRRSGNRQMTLPMLIESSDPLVRADLENQVYLAANLVTFPLTWTPDGGIPVVYDCFRATTSIVSKLIDTDVKHIQIQCEALPFGRSLNEQSVDIAALPIVVLDDFEDGTRTVHNQLWAGHFISNYTSQGIVSAPTYTGSGALKIDYTGAPYSVAGATVIETGLTVDTPADGVFSAFLAVKGADMKGGGYAPDRAAWVLTLTVDGFDYTASFTPPFRPTPAWRVIVWQFSSPIPAGTITGYTIKSPLIQVAIPNYLLLDHLMVSPEAAEVVASTRGVTVDVGPIAGSARAPVALELARADAGDFGSWIAHTVPPDTPTAQPLIPFALETSYTVDDPVRYRGTYAVWLSIFDNVEFGASTVTITFTQGGVTATRTASYTGFTGIFEADSTVQLPLIGYPPDGVQPLTVEVSGGGVGDIDNPISVDVVLLDTRGQSIVVNGAPAHSGAFTDVPDPSVKFGGIWGGDDRTTALSVSAYVQSPTTLILEAGITRMMLYALEGVLTGTATYFPRWVQEATV